jgi:uncharacterized protein
MSPEAPAEDELRAAAGVFEQSPDVLVGYAFGSRVQGRAHRESDLDLAVLLDWGALPDRAARSERQIELIGELIGAAKINEIDLVVLNDAPPLLARDIVREGRLLHAASQSHVHDLLRDVQLRAADLEPFVRRARQRLLESFDA